MLFQKSTEVVLHHLDHYHLGQAIICGLSPCLYLYPHALFLTLQPGRSHLNQSPIILLIGSKTLLHIPPHSAGASVLNPGLQGPTCPELYHPVPPM